MQLLCLLTADIIAGLVATVVVLTMVKLMLLMMTLLLVVQTLCMTASTNSMLPLLPTAITWTTSARQPLCICCNLKNNITTATASATAVFQTICCAAFAAVLLLLVHSYQITQNDHCVIWLVWKSLPKQQYQQQKTDSQIVETRAVVRSRAAVVIIVLQVAANAVWL